MSRKIAFLKILGNPIAIIIIIFIIINVFFIITAYDSFFQIDNYFNMLKQTHHVGRVMFSRAGT